jgi:hypothetical protein
MTSSVICVFLFEVMDKEWPLLWVLVVFLGIGFFGMLVCRKRPLLWFVIVPVLVLFAVGHVSELNDPFVGPAIVREAGRSYVVLSYLSICAGVVLPSLGVYLWRRQRKQRIDV